MRNVTKEEWVTALRSGEYRQGKGFLRNSDDEYCCLGVLCDLAGMQWQSTRIGAFRAEANDCFSTTGIPLDSKMSS